MATPPLDLASCDAVLFDLDGVFTPTALVHELAWTAMFNEFLEARGTELAATSMTPFGEADYLKWVDGMPRYDGVRSFLNSRSIVLPDGNTDDSPGHDTVCALGKRKNEQFNRIVSADGVAPYVGSIAVLEYLDSRDVPQAVVSSSKNAVQVLNAAGLGGRFDVIVDGVVAATEGLAGKPAPDGFLLGAHELGVDPAKSVVVEDAVSGVQAGVAGGFGLVIGVDRTATGELAAAGAHVVVADLAELLEMP